MLAFSILAAPVIVTMAGCSGDEPSGSQDRVAQGNSICNSPGGAKRASFIVTLRKPVNDAAGAVRGLVASVGGEPRFARTWKHVPGFAAELDDAAVEALRADPNVARVEPDGHVQVHLTQSLPLIHADKASASGYRGAGQKVIILDTGVASEHPALKGKVVDEACFCADDCTGCCPNGERTQFGAGAAADDEGHGSHVAGIVAGVAPAAKLVVVKVLSARGKGEDSSTISALDWVLEHHPDAAAINMSFGDSTQQFAGDCNGTFVSYGAAIDKLRSKGVITVAASGNEASSTGINHPACIKNALSVGAVYDANLGALKWTNCEDLLTKADKMTCFSNSAPNLDILAPGAKITSVDYRGGTTDMAGTSQAAPHVAGAVAVVRAANPGLTPASIEDILKSTGVPIKDSRNNLTRSRIDVDAAAKEAARR